jgi:glutathione peroxidase
MASDAPEFQKVAEFLEFLFQKWVSKRFVVLGFPSNSFGSEPGGITSIKTKYLKYMSFPILYPTRVNGPKGAPLFAYLTHALPGISGVCAIRWNFEMFITDRKGIPVRRCPPTEQVEFVEQFIDRLL